MKRMCSGARNPDAIPGPFGVMGLCGVPGGIEP